jgi:hypothetical protein
MNRARFYSFIRWFTSVPALTLGYMKATSAPEDLALLPELRLTWPGLALYPRLYVTSMLKPFADTNPHIYRISVVWAYGLTVADYMGYYAGFAALLRGNRVGLLVSIITLAVPTATLVLVCAFQGIVFPFLPWWLCDLVSGQGSSVFFKFFFQSPPPSVSRTWSPRCFAFPSLLAFS